MGNKQAMSIYYLSDIDTAQFAANVSSFTPLFISNFTLVQRIKLLAFG